ncbi:hypothetical protein [Sphingopyxis sp.]|uniref:hypothetical protein n=1 Tax=Sphingopyxis sp. TaxID=1908224 RepID=UPI0035B021D0
MANATYNETDDRTNNSVYSTITPNHLCKIWATYQLPASLSRWKIGGGVTTQSASHSTGTVTQINRTTGEVIAFGVPLAFSQKDYALVDALLEYQISESLTGTLNVKNIFDKTYYATTGTSSWGNFNGEPRNWMVTLNGKF